METHANPPSAKSVDEEQKPGRPNFTGLEASPEFLHLVTQYPNLKTQLKAVWQATQEPTEDNPHPSQKARESIGASKYRRRMTKGPWTAEQGHQDGCDLLRELQGSDEGVREFVDLIGLKNG